AVGNDGGPRQTQALLANSPAIDAGVNCPPPSVDQRGVVRPQGTACDSGAFELQGPVNTPTPSPTTTPTTTPTLAATLTPVPTRTATATPTPVPNNVAQIAASLRPD